MGSSIPTRSGHGHPFVGWLSVPPADPARNEIDYLASLRLCRLRQQMACQEPLRITTTNMSHKQWRDWVSPDIGYIQACPGLPIPADG